MQVNCEDATCGTRSPFVPRCYLLILSVAPRLLSKVGGLGKLTFDLEECITVALLF